MSTTSIGFAAIMLAAGTGIPLLAALSGRLGVDIGSAPAAAVVALAVALLCTILFAVATGGPTGSDWYSAPLKSYSGGLFLAFYLISITWIAPRFGLSNAIFFVLLGQIASSAVIDHFGLIGTIRVKVDATRLVGIGLMRAGIYLARRTSGA
jgi:transporter family-2 protein